MPNQLVQNHKPILCSIERDLNQDIIISGTVEGGELLCGFNTKAKTPTAALKRVTAFAQQNGLNPNQIVLAVPHRSPKPPAPAR